MATDFLQVPDEKQAMNFLQIPGQELATNCQRTPDQQSAMPLTVPNQQSAMQGWQVHLLLRLQSIFLVSFLQKYCR